MTKRELIWLLVRIAGLYFLAKGLLLALEVSVGILVLWLSSDPDYAGLALQE